MRSDAEGGSVRNRRRTVAPQRLSSAKKPPPPSPDDGFGISTKPVTRCRALGWKLERPRAPGRFMLTRLWFRGRPTGTVDPSPEIRVRPLPSATIRFPFFPGRDGSPRTCPHGEILQAVASPLCLAAHCRLRVDCGSAGASSSSPAPSSSHSAACPVLKNSSDRQTRGTTLPAGVSDS